MHRIIYQNPINEHIHYLSIQFLFPGILLHRGNRITHAIIGSRFTLMKLCGNLSYLLIQTFRLPGQFLPNSQVIILFQFPGHKPVNIGKPLRLAFLFILLKLRQLLRRAQVLTLSLIRPLLCFLRRSVRHINQVPNRMPDHFIHIRFPAVFPAALSGFLMFGMRTEDIAVFPAICDIRPEVHRPSACSADSLTHKRTCLAIPSLILLRILLPEPLLDFKELFLRDNPRMTVLNCDLFILGYRNGMRAARRHRFPLMTYNNPIVNLVLQNFVDGINIPTGQFRYIGKLLCPRILPSVIRRRRFISLVIKPACDIHRPHTVQGGVIYLPDNLSRLRIDLDPVLVILSPPVPIRDVAADIQTPLHFGAFRSHNLY